jgi:hypothetical protein
MHVEILVEERSAEEVLKSLMPGILGPDVTFAIHSYQGKQDLLGKLPGRLKAYRSWLPRDWRIAVLVDSDDEDCRSSKRRWTKRLALLGCESGRTPVPASRF